MAAKSSTNDGAALLGSVRARIEERRCHERAQIFAAILFVSLGLAPLTHELAVAAARPKSSLSFADEGKKEVAVPAAATPESPSLFPLLLALAVVVAGVLVAGVVFKELQEWDSTDERLARDLDRLLKEQGGHDEAWRLALVLRGDDKDGSHLGKVNAALQRHLDVGYPSVAPVRFAFDRLVLWSALLATVLVAGALAIRWKLMAVPSAQWLLVSRLVKDQGLDVLTGPLSPLTLLSAVVVAGTGMVSLVVGWMLGRSTPSRSPAPAQPTAPDRIEAPPHPVPHQTIANAFKSNPLIANILIGARP